MPQRDGPAAGEGIFVLRVVRGWEPDELARAAGLKPRSLGSYERGADVPPAAQQALLAALGFSPPDLEAAMAFVHRSRLAIRWPGPAADPSGRGSGPGLGRVGREAAQWFEGLVQAGLAEALPAEARPATPAPSTEAPAGRPAERAGEDDPPHALSPVPAAPPWGEALLILRTLRGLSQKELAQATGIPSWSISAYERLSYAPRASTLERLLEAMGCPFAVWEEALWFLQNARQHGPAAARREAGEGLRQEIERVANAESHAVAEFVAARFNRVLTAARLARSRQAAPALWRRLERCSPASRQWLVASSKEFHDAGFCELLCEESRRSAGDSAERARELAALAVVAAERLPGTAGWRSRVTGYARAHLANALRVGGDLPAAAAEMQHAVRAWQEGAADDPGLLNEARLLHLQASLCRDQRRLPETFRFLDQALAGDRWGETPCLLISKAKTLEETGGYEAALGLLQEAGARLEGAAGQSEPRLQLSVRVNLLILLCHLGRHTDAALLVDEVKGLARALGNDLDRVRVLWLDGRIASGLERLDEAAAIYGRVRGEFLARGIAYDAALATLELAGAYNRLGRTADVRRLARESAPIFAAQGVHREAQMALRLFQQAAEQEALTSQLVERLVTYLCRARKHPELRFDASS